MADLQKTTYEYQITANFSDGDTRVIKVPDPNTNLNADSITSCFNYAVENNIIIGDKTGAPLTEFSEVNKLEKTVTTLDLD